MGEEILNEERLRWPGWERAAAPVPEAYWERLEREWSVADFVIVNSRWTRRALERQGVPSEKIKIIPLAYEPRVTPHPSELQRRRGQDNRFRVLWVGNVDLRKGIQYLLGAAHQLLSSSIDFEIAGLSMISPEIVASAPRNVRFIGHVPRPALSEVYSRADLFVFPTLSDGFGLTQLEAMAHGLPVIATPNCGDVVSDGVDGFLIPIRDETALAASIVRIAEDRVLQERLSQGALEKSKAFSIDQLADRLESVELLTSMAPATRALDFA